MDIIPAEQSGRIEPEVEEIPQAHSEPITAKPDQQSWDTLEERWADPPGVIGWFRALQNDAVGGRIMATAFVFFLMAGLLAILMRFQLISPESTLIGPEMYNRFFTMHGSTMMYLFAVPMIEGMAIFLLPLMLGNREMPFPRLGVFSYFTFLFGGLLFYSSFLLNAAPDTGWFAYVPLSGPEFSPGIALDFWLLALSVAEIGAIAAGIEIIIAILKMRAPGMSLSRMPLYAWSMLVTAGAILFAFTPLIVGSLLLELDRKFGTHFYNPDMNGSPILWQHLFWIFGHPEVYIQFIPAVGMLSMIVPVFSRQRIMGYTLIATAMVSTGFLSFGLWVHHMFTVGIPQITLTIFSVASILIAIPSGVQIFSYLATILNGRPIWKTPFLFVVGFLVTFVIGGITGVMVGVVPFDWQVHDSYFVVAHFHYVLIGGVVFPIFAALYYWMPKFTGKLLDDRLGKWNFWLMFSGFHITFFPQHIAGLLGMPRRVYTYEPNVGLEVFNAVSTVGSVILAAGVLFFVINFFYHLKYGAAADANPWGADSLEWAMSSPPANFGFAVLPIVHGRHPLWEEKPITEGDPKTLKIAQTLGRWPTKWRAAVITSLLDARPEEIFRVSGPSIWPFVASVGMITIFASEIFTLRFVSLIGIAIVLISLAGWHWPDPPPITDEEEAQYEEELGIMIRPNGSRAVARWGMGLFILLLAIALSSFLFTYFYIRLENDVWPAGNLPLPHLWPAAIGSLLLLASGGSLYAGLKGIQHGQNGRLSGGLLGHILLNAAALAALLYDFNQLTFTHQTNAYGSVFYTLGGYLMAIVLAGSLMNALILFWNFRGHITQRRYVSVENSMMFWVATAVAWFLIIGILYIYPYIGAGSL